MTQPSTLSPGQHPPRHYPTAGAKVADLVVHVIGLTLAIVGGGLMLGLAIASGRGGLIAAICIYAIGMIAMFSFSTAYNFAPAPKRPGRNKFDHAGIFLMIGASYTPFTTQSLSGTWSWAMTSVVWGIVGICVAAKLAGIGLPDRFWTATYIALGWIVVVALAPLVSALNGVSLLLLFLGGVLYTVGVIFYVNKSLKWARAIWHGHVVAGAALHWAAILIGVVILPV